MKKTRIGLIGGILTLSSALSPVASVMAANSYNINYTGGEDLGSANVTIDPELVDGLTQLIRANTNTNVETSSSPEWKTGYYNLDGSCRKTDYFKVWKDSSFNNLSYTVIDKTKPYYETIKFNSVVIDGLSSLSEDSALAVNVGEYNGWFYTRAQIYSDDECQNKVPDVKALSNLDGNGGKIFVETNIKLYEKSTNQAVASNQLYFGFSDIDAGQSFKILNSDTQMIKNNMFAKVASALQPTTDTPLRNKYVDGGNYIYSQYDLSLPSTTFNISDSDNIIFVKVGESAQTDGLNVVFGFTGAAGSATMFHAKQYNVKYVSDKNGEITSELTSEDIISGQNPSGTEQTPNQGYDLEHWMADGDVKLEKNKEMKAGQPITEEQIKQVIVDQNITFTAIYKAKPVEKPEAPKEPSIGVPDTGESTGETNAISIVVSTVSIVILALFVGLLPKLTHKKIDFKK